MNLKKCLNKQLRCNNLIIEAMLKRRQLANKAIVNICDYKISKIKIVK